MRVLLLSMLVLLSACSSKDAEVAPAPENTGAPAAQASANAPAAQAPRTNRPYMIPRPKDTVTYQAKTLPAAPAASPKALASAPIAARPGAAPPPNMVAAPAFKPVVPRTAAQVLAPPKPLSQTMPMAFAACATQIQAMTKNSPQFKLIQNDAVAYTVEQRDARSVRRMSCDKTKNTVTASYSPLQG